MCLQLLPDRDRLDQDGRRGVLRRRIPRGECLTGGVASNQHRDPSEVD